MNNFRPDAVTCSALSVVEARNSDVSIDNFIDSVELLPASGSVSGV